jgi:hypothetical protein
LVPVKDRERHKRQNASNGDTFSSNLNVEFVLLAGANDKETSQIHCQSQNNETDQAKLNLRQYPAEKVTGPMVQTKEQRYCYSISGATDHNCRTCSNHQEEIKNSWFGCGPCQ